MIAALVAVASASVGQVSHFGPGAGDDRPIAMIAPYPAGMADDVRRPGFNGRLWVGRPVMGAIQQGPYPLGWGEPGPEAYGAFDNQDARVPVRIGHLVVGITPWERVHQSGLQDYENARNFWLREQGYTGGVRTFVNDLYVWAPSAASPEEGKQVQAPGEIVPRATIQVPVEMRQRRRLRVDAGGDSGAVLARAVPGAGEGRVSWPGGAPRDLVARTEARAAQEEAPAGAMAAAK